MRGGDAFCTPTLARVRELIGIRPGPEGRSGFADCIPDDDESGERVGPPPAEQSIERQADQDRGCEARVEQGDAAFGLQDWVVERPAGGRFTLREDHHHDTGGCGPHDGERGGTGVVRATQYVCRLRGDVDREREERVPDQPKAECLALPGRSGQFPHDDERSPDFDRGVESESRGCGRPRLDRGDDEDRHANDVPGEGCVFEAEPSTCERVVHAYRMPDRRESRCGGARFEATRNDQLLAWGVVADGLKPDRYDLIGAAICLVGVGVIMFAPRPA